MEVQFVKFIEEDAAGNRGDAIGMVILYTGGGGYGGSVRHIMKGTWRKS